MTVRRRGLSLVELLIAIALLIALFGSMFGFLFNTLQKREWLNERVDRQRAVSTLIEQLERDLTSVVAAHGGETGLRGTASSLTVLSRGVDAGTAPTAGAGVLFGDLVRTSYTFDEGRGVTFERMPVSSRRATETTTLGETVARVRFRYHDGSDWQDRFDCMTAGGLPRAVEIAVWYLGTEDEDEAGDIEAFESQLYDKRTRDRGPSRDRMAMESDDDVDDREPDPLPDRIRVIAVPDSAPSTPIRAMASEDDLFSGGVE